MKTYFLGIPVGDSVCHATDYITNAPLFGIDSIVGGKGMYSRFRSDTSVTPYQDSIVKVLISTSYVRHPETNTILDTNYSVIVSYYFSNRHRTERQAFYEQLTEAFKNVYKYRSESKGGGVNGYRISRFTNDKSALFHELYIYATMKDGVPLVTLNFEKRNSLTFALPKRY
ncbi:hypothetical protein HRH25_05695 [Flavisolibacter sp. BT320]|nr:hypothetical protein [Flavisolibacter longurius]